MLSQSEQPKTVKTKDTQSSKNNAHQKRNMYSSVVIRGFRLFEYLELNDLAKLNLFFGPNNTGKTSALEAIYTHACGLNFVPFLGQVVSKRQNGKVSGALNLGEKFMSLFHDTSSPPYSFEISAKVIGDDSTYTVKSTFHPSSALSDLDPRALGQFSESFPLTPQTDAQFLENTLEVIDQPVRIGSSQIQTVFLGKWQTQLNDEKSEVDLLYPPSVVSARLFKLANMYDILSHRNPDTDIRVFSHLKRYGFLSEFKKEMQPIFPMIREIDMIPYPDGTQGPVYVAVADGRQIPLYAFGDGMRRWFSLLGQMLVYKDGVHCIEDIEATFHPAAHQDLSRLLLQYAEKFNNQLFLTSHSIEFADAFLNALYGEAGVISPDREDPVRVFTVKPSQNIARPDIWALKGRDAYEMRQNYELELR